MFNATPRTTEGSSPAVVAGAVRAAGRVDRSAVSVAAGLLAAVPVVALLGGGLAFNDNVAAVTMAAGAMLVGSAWRTGGGQPPLVLMATDAMLMALSTFVGSAAGSRPWIHLALLCLWALPCGLLVALGRRGAVLGTQAIIALIVFGRFGQPPGAALGLAGLVLAGGLAQVIFLSIVRWPSPLRVQRAKTAAAYEALAELATEPATASTLPAATALDEAQAALASGALFGDPAVITLRSLVSEGHRMRVQLSALHILMDRRNTPEHEPADASQTDDLTPSSRERAARMLTLTCEALTEAARAMTGHDHTAEALERKVRAAGAESAAVARELQSDASGPLTGARATDWQLSRRLAALGGQLRAVASLAPAAATDGGLRARRPQRRVSQTLPRLRADIALLRANASLQSPAGRHALRLAIVVPAAEIIARQLPLSRGYWMAVAAATVLRPEFGATLTRGTERAVGTALGVALAGGIVVGLHPTGAATVAIVAVMAWAAYSTFPASFAVGFSFLTALVVFLLNAVSPDTLSTASSRLLDTLAGGTFGLIVYALWPSWARLPARRALAELVAAQRAYVAAIMAALVAGRRADPDEMRSRSRQARLARTKAESTVATSLNEPATRRLDSDWSQAVLATARRLVQAAHVLRLDAEEERERQPLPALAPLARDVDALLDTVHRRIEAEARDGASEAMPDLRADYGAVEREYADDADAAAVIDELDEVVDAANGLAALVGLDPGESTVAPEPSPPPRRLSDSHFTA
jgi:uncharacterized membrane protein YccC